MSKFLNGVFAYKFKMDVYGKYFAVYKADDGVENTITKKIIYVVEDDQKPTIEGTFNKSVDVNINEKVTFDTVSFTDNVTAKEDISYICYVKDPNGIISRVKYYKDQCEKLRNDSLGGSRRADNDNNNDEV